WRLPGATPGRQRLRLAPAPPPALPPPCDQRLRRWSSPDPKLDITPRGGRRGAVKRNAAVAVATAVLVAGVGLGAAVLTSRTAGAAPASAPLPVAYNGVDGWHQGRVRLPVI